MVNIIYWRLSVQIDNPCVRVCARGFQWSNRNILCVLNETNCKEAWMDNENEQTIKQVRKVIECTTLCDLLNRSHKCHLSTSWWFTAWYFTSFSMVDDASVIPKRSGFQWWPSMIIMLNSHTSSRRLNIHNYYQRTGNYEPLYS